MRFILAAMVMLGTASAAGAKDINGPLDPSGRPFHLSSLGEERLVVVAFLGVDCPLAGLYSNRLNELAEAYGGRGVGFVAVNSNRHDTRDAVAAFAQKLKFAMVKDESGAVADEFGATHSPEVFLLDGSRDVIYRGRIDDQYTPGVHGRSEPSRRDLEEAITEALALRPVSVSETRAIGCRIDRGPAPNDTATSDTGPGGAGAVTYSKDIAPIFDARCVECHRPGEAAPFSLLTYDDVVAWKDAIRDVVDEKRMPPWGARGGHFVNDRSLSESQRALVLRWIDLGAAEGNPADRPAPPKFSSGWSIRPDRVFSMAAPFVVPKEGVLDYEEFAIDPGFTSDTWVQAVEISPGNRGVVHHINVYVKPKNARPDELFVNGLGDYYLAMAVPGNSITTMPEGTAKLIPAGWNVVLSVHYVPNGTEQTDTSSIALELAEPGTVRRQMATRAILDDALVIAPFEKKTVRHAWMLEDDYTLFALYPHMHWRGKSMRFEARYPNGETDVLLDVFAYDFAWQYRYVLGVPKALPRGTVVTATALYDNSAENKNNPDPAAVVHAGRQSTDEMFQACFEICRTHEDLTARRHGGLTIGWVAVALVAAFSLVRRAAKR